VNRVHNSLVVVVMVGVVVVGGMISACSGARSPTKRTCTGAECDSTNGPQTYCARDSECPADQYCTGGTCQPRDSSRPDGACTAHADCTAGMFCNVVTGHCVQCLNEDHCDVGLICRADGTCGTNTGCATNADCGALKCDTATHGCVQCLTSGDCPSGQTCRGNQCFTSGNTDPVCTQQTQCDAYGKICDATGHCTACTTTAQCGANRTCTGGQCVSSSTPPGDGSCQTMADCGGQACFLNMCMPCFSDFMCISLDDLMSGVMKICDTNTLTCINPQCQTANECAAGEGCYSGHCGACVEDSECRSGEVCNPSTGVCGDPNVNPPTGCTSNAGCTGGQVCVATACVNCTSSAQCTGGQTCGADGRCTTGTPPTPGDFGATCTTSDECKPGLTCLTASSGNKCTRTCIGSGKGGDSDCPSGWACVDFEEGDVDGLIMCESAGMLPSTFPGQPFTQAPGASCSSGNACQTSVCFSESGECARGCAANRDCAAGEVCYALMYATGVNTGEDFCFPSDTTTYKPVDAACSDTQECDSGLCEGKCANGALCNTSGDCASGTCVGTCRDHCRSNADCKATEACNPWPTKAGTPGSGWVPSCSPKYYSGTKLDGAACAADSECNSDWCVGSICTTPCAIKADCTGALAGKSCQAVGFVDANDNPVYSLAFCK
jgi:hypothetical protein